MKIVVAWWRFADQVDDTHIHGTFFDYQAAYIWLVDTCRIWFQDRQKDKEGQAFFLAHYNKFMETKELADAVDALDTWREWCEQAHGHAGTYECGVTDTVPVGTLPEVSERMGQALMEEPIGYFLTLVESKLAPIRDAVTELQDFMKYFTVDIAHRLDSAKERDRYRLKYYKALQTIRAECSDGLAQHLTEQALRDE
jgi:hypothetical protein